MSITRQDLRDLRARYNPETGRELDPATTRDEERQWNDVTCGTRRTEIRDDFTARWWAPWALLAVAIAVGLIVRAIWGNV